MDGFTSDEATPPIRGIELVTRNSIHSLRAPSLSSNVSFFSNDNYVWNLSDLRVSYNLHFFWMMYIKRLSTNTILKDLIVLRNGSRIKTWRNSTAVTSNG